MSKTELQHRHCISIDVDATLLQQLLRDLASDHVLYVSLLLRYQALLFSQKSEAAKFEDAIVLLIFVGMSFPVPNLDNLAHGCKKLNSNTDTA